MKRDANLHQRLKTMAVTNETQIRWTSADLEFFPDNGDRYEIINGDLYVTRAPHWKHQNAITNLCTALSSSTIVNQQGKVVIGAGVIFNNENDVIPDVIWISNEKLAICVDESGHFTAAPELVIEVLFQTSRDISRAPQSGSQRDRQVKLKLYSRVGVKEYWIVDWQQKTVEIYRRSQARLELICTLFVEDELTTPLFPEFSLKVAEIFV